MNVVEFDQRKWFRWFTIFFFFFLFGKYYYLFFGWASSTKALAPVPFVILKDVGLMFFLSVFIPAYVWGRKKINFNFLTGFLLCLLFFLALSSSHLSHLLYAEWMQHHVRNLFFYLCFIFFGYVLVPPAKLKNIFNVVVLACVINAIVAVASIFLLPQRTNGGRAVGFIDSPNTLAALLNAGLIITYSKLIYLKKIRYLYISLILFAGLISTVSLTYTAISLAFMFLYSAFYFRRTPIALIILLLLFAGAVAFFFANADTFLPLFSRITDVTNAILYDNQSVRSVGVRVNQYTALLDTIEQASWMEILFGNFLSDIYVRFDSTYLVFIYNFGLIPSLGLMAYFLLILAKLFVVRTTYTQNASFVLEMDILISFYIIFFLSGIPHNIFSHFPVNIIFYVLFGYILKMLRDRWFMREKSLYEI